MGYCEDIYGVSGAHGVYGNYVFGDDVYIPDEHLDEQWAPYDSIDGYWVSTHGRIWSAKRQQFIKPKRMDKHGHVGFSMASGSKSRKPKYVYLHRAIAQSFIDNPDGYPIVRHLNDDPKDNELHNLAWGTQRDNWDDSVSNGHAKVPTDEARERGCEKTRVPVIVTDLRTGEEKWFRGQCEAARYYGVQQANAYKVLVGQRKHSRGYHFRYADGDAHD